MADLLTALQNDRSLKAELLAAYPELAEDHQALIDTLDSVSDLDEQIIAALRAAVEREAHAEALAALIKQMQERKGRLEAGADKLRGVCLYVMQESSRSRINAPDMTVTVQQGRAGVTVIDETVLPEEFVKVTRTPKLKEIGDAVKAGREVPGTAPRNPRPFLSVRRT